MRFFLYDNCKGGDPVAMHVLYGITPRLIGFTLETEYLVDQFGRRRTLEIYLWSKIRRFWWIVPETTRYNRIRGLLKYFNE